MRSSSRHTCLRRRCCLSHKIRRPGGEGGIGAQSCASRPRDRRRSLRRQRRLLRSGCRTAVVVPLPVQLPCHGKPGVGLGELELGAPPVLLDVDVGPALLSVDLLVDRLAAAERLVTASHGLVPTQLPPFRHGSPLPSQARVEPACPTTATQLSMPRVFLAVAQRPCVVDRPLGAPPPSPSIRRAPPLA